MTRVLKDEKTLTSNELGVEFKIEHILSESTMNLKQGMPRKQVKLFFDRLYARFGEDYFGQITLALLSIA